MVGCGAKLFEMDLGTNGEMDIVVDIVQLFRQEHPRRGVALTFEPSLPAR